MTARIPAHVTRPALPWRPIAGVLAAIGITTAMDASGLSAFSALPLLPLMLALAYVERRSRRELGFVRGAWRHHALALAHPLLVIGVVAVVAFAAGAVDTSETSWPKAWRDAALISVTTFLVAMLTEEGFFRGWLWASLERSGRGADAVLVWSSVAFALWHLSAVVLDTGFGLPASQVPVFMLNAVVMGAAWGLLRRISGSVVVASVSHGVWNGLAYSFFGFGTRVGALGIRDTSVHAPESGLVGLAVGAAFVAMLWALVARPRPAPDSRPR